MPTLPDMVNQQYQKGSISEIKNTCERTDNAKMPFVAAYDFKKRNNNQNNRSKFKYVNNNLMGIQGEK